MYKLKIGWHKWPKSAKAPVVAATKKYFILEIVIHSILYLKYTKYTGYNHLQNAILSFWVQYSLDSPGLSMGDPSDAQTVLFELCVFSASVCPMIVLLFFISVLSVSMNRPLILTLPVSLCS